MYSNSTEIKLYHPQLISNFYSDKYTTYRNMELTGQDIDTIGMLQLILQECKHATKTWSQLYGLHCDQLPLN